METRKEIIWKKKCPELMDELIKSETEKRIIREKLKVVSKVLNDIIYNREEKK